MQENKTYRIRAKVGDETENVINVKLDQHYDSFEILSLKIDQENFYKTYESDYGVVVGRVIANGGFGVPNAKVSIFIESDNDDDIESRIFYPYKSPRSKNNDGIRYNLLTDFLDKACYQNVGTFPNKRLVLDNDDVIDVFDKYYRYTTVTNNAGDYMIFGVPTGSQRLHVDIDLSDIGMLSQRPRDMVYKGYDINLFDSPNKFKQDTNLDSLAQIKTQDLGLYVYPFWGDTSEGVDNIAVTRADIQLDYKFEPTCVFMGSIITDTGSNAIGKNCTSTEKVGKMSELIAGEGSIEMIRKTYDGKVEEFQVKGNRVIDGDGVWCYQIPMNLDYIMTDEFGNIAPSDNPEKGIPTRTRVRFRISLDDAPDDNTARKRCRYLVPNNPRLDEDRFPQFTKTKEPDYEFGTRTREESYKDLLWNKVYTVKNYVPRLQKNRKVTDRKHTGIKLINHHEANNPMPYNNIDIKLGFTYRLLCVIFKIFINMVQFLNQILTALSLGICVIYKALMWIAGLFKFPVRFLGWPFRKLAGLFEALIIPCVGISSDMCGGNTTHNLTFYPGCGNLMFSGKSAGSAADCIREKTSDSHNKKEDKKIKNHEIDESERTIPLMGGTEELYNCVETALAEDNDTVSLNFQNDWINGTLYAPMWFRKITKKRSYLFGLIKRRAKDQWCEGEKNYNRKILRVFNPCAPKRPGKVSYANYENESVTAHYMNFSDNKRYSDSCRDKCHESKKGINLDKGLIVKRQTMLGQDVYYYKPVEYGSPLDSLIENSDDFATGEKDFGNGSVKILFATDIVLLGSLNDCDIHGVPQFFKSLESSTFQIPPNLLFTDNEIIVEMSKGSGQSAADDDPDNVKVEYSVTEVSTSEMTGMDWGNFNEDICGKWNDSQDSGLFYSIGCSTIKMKPKSCINMSRICEFGVSLDETKAFLKAGVNVNSEDSPIDEVLYDTITPDGFVSKDELYNDDERSLFATLNINGLHTERNPESGLMEYVFKHVVADNFDKSLYAYMLERQSKCSLTQKYNYVLEDFSKGYYDFRMGRTPYFYDEGKGYQFPRYENSFYFYFGLNPGKTAIDKFNSQFTSNCENANTALDPVDIEAVGNSWCSEMDGKGDGYVAFNLSYIDLPCDIIIRCVSDASFGEVVFENNEDEMFYVARERNAELESRGYARKQVPIPYDVNGNGVIENGEFLDYFPNGTYEVTITDNNGEIIMTSFIMKVDMLKSYIVATDFSEPENVLLKEFGSECNIAANKNCLPAKINDWNINTTRGIGGTIAISMPYNSRTGELIESFKIVIEQLGGNYGCLVWYCGGRLRSKSEQCIYLLGNNSNVFIFGLPKGDETYRITITELCCGSSCKENDCNESGNIYVEEVLVHGAEHFKLFVNGTVDYDVVKHWKSGFDCNAASNPPTVSVSGTISEKWWHMSNPDNYLWFNYDPYNDSDKRIVQLIGFYDNAVQAIKEAGYKDLYDSLKNSTYANKRDNAKSIGSFLRKSEITILNHNDNDYAWSPKKNCDWEDNYGIYGGETGIIAEENDSLSDAISGILEEDEVGGEYTHISDGVTINWLDYLSLSDSEKENYVRKTVYDLYLELKNKGYVSSYNDFATKMQHGEMCYVIDGDCKQIVNANDVWQIIYVNVNDPSDEITPQQYDGLGYANVNDPTDTITQAEYDALEYAYQYDNTYTVSQSTYDSGYLGYVSVNDPEHVISDYEYNEGLPYNLETDSLPSDPDGILTGENAPSSIARYAEYDALGYIYVCNGIIRNYVSKEDYDNGDLGYASGECGFSDTGLYACKYQFSEGSGLEFLNEITSSEYMNLGYVQGSGIEIYKLSDPNVLVSVNDWLAMTEVEQQQYAIDESIFEALYQDRHFYEDSTYDFDLSLLYNTTRQLLQYEYTSLKDYYSSEKDNYRPLSSSDFVSERDNYRSLKDDYVLKGSDENYTAMTFSDILDCWFEDEDMDNLSENTKEEIESLFSALISINEEIIEILDGIEEMKREFINEAKRAFQLNCPDEEKTIFFLAQTNNKPVVYHGVYKPEMMEYDDSDNAYYTVECEYIYTDEGDTVDMITIPTITYRDSDRFGLEESQSDPIGNNGLPSDLCYAYDNMSDCEGKNSKKRRKYCYFIAVRNRRGRRIPNDVEPKEGNVCPDKVPENVKLTKKYFGYHIIDKVFNKATMAWSVVDNVPYYKPLTAQGCIDEKKAGISMCMNGLFTGKLFNGNVTEDIPLSGACAGLLDTKFPLQRLGGYDMKIYTGINNGETIPDVEDKMPTRRYIVDTENSLNEFEKSYDQFRVTKDENGNQEDTDNTCLWANCQKRQQYVPVLRKSMELVIEDESTCQLNDTIDGRMKIVLEGTSVNVSSESKKTRRKGCKLNVKLQNTGNAEQWLFLVFSVNNYNANTIEYPLNLSERAVPVSYEKDIESVDFLQAVADGLFDKEGGVYIHPEAEQYYFGNGSDELITPDNYQIIVDDVESDSHQESVYRLIDEETYNNLPPEEQEGFTEVEESGCRQVKYDCDMGLNGPKLFVDDQRNLFSYYNNIRGYRRIVNPFARTFNLQQSFGEKMTVTELLSKYVDSGSDKEYTTYGFGSTGQFTFNNINGYSDAYYVVAITDNNVRAISPVYDYCYLCSKLIFGIVYTKVETTDESGAVDGYTTVTSPKATFDIGNVVTGTIDENCVDPYKIKYYFYYYPYDISFEWKIDEANSISGSYRHTAYRINPKGYLLFDINDATYDAIFKIYKNSKGRTGKFRDNATIEAHDVTGLRHLTQWVGCKLGNWETGYLPCNGGVPDGCVAFEKKTWVTITWVTNGGKWKKENCAHYVDEECGCNENIDEGCQYGSEDDYSRLFVPGDTYNPYHVGTLERDCEFGGWAASYDSNVAVPNEMIQIEGKPEESMIYYAIWPCDFVTVTWVDCNGIEIQTEEGVKKGIVYKLSDMPKSTDPNVVFIRWYAAELGEEQSYDDDDLVWTQIDDEYEITGETVFKADCGDACRPSMTFYNCIDIGKYTIPLITLDFKVYADYETYELSQEDPDTYKPIRHRITYFPPVNMGSYGGMNDHEVWDCGETFSEGNVFVIEILDVEAGEGGIGCSIYSTNFDSNGGPDCYWANSILAESVVIGDKQPVIIGQHCMNSNTKIVLTTNNGVDCSCSTPLTVRWMKDCENNVLHFENYVCYGDYITPPAANPKMEGCLFDYWNDGTTDGSILLNPVTPSTQNVNGVITICAEYKCDGSSNHTVEFYAGQSLVKSDTVDNGYVLTDADVPLNSSVEVPYGEEWDETWVYKVAVIPNTYLEVDRRTREEIIGLAINADTRFIASFSDEEIPEYHTIKYYLNNVLIDTDNIQVGSSERPTAPTAQEVVNNPNFPSGYSFSETWNIIGTDINYSTSYINNDLTVNNNFNFSAVLTQDAPPTPQNVTVSFDYNYPTEVDKDKYGNALPQNTSSEVNQGTEITALSAPELTNYEFVGWHLNGGSTQIPQGQNITINANAHFEGEWNRTMPYQLNWLIMNNSRLIINGITVYFMAYNVSDHSLDTECTATISTGGGFSTNEERHGTTISISGLPNASDYTYLQPIRASIDYEFGGHTYENTIINRSPSSGVAYLGDGPTSVANVFVGYTFRQMMGSSCIVDPNCTDVLTIGVYDGDGAPTGPFTIQYYVRADNMDTIVSEKSLPYGTVLNDSGNPPIIPPEIDFLNAIGGSTGYTLAGWLNNKDPHGMTVISNETYTRIANRRILTAYFRWGDPNNTETTRTAEYGSTISDVPQAANAPYYQDHTFVEWNPNPSNTPITENEMVFNGEWTYAPTPVPYDVIFVAYGDGLSETLIKSYVNLTGSTSNGNGWNVPTQQAIFDKVNSTIYSFDKWTDMNGNDVDPYSITVDAYTEFRALMAKNKFTVRFDFDATNQITSAETTINNVEYGTTLTDSQVPVDATAEGYNFLYWFKGNDTNPLTRNDILAIQITENITFYGQWEQQTIEQGTIKFRVRDDDDYSTPIVYWNMDSFTITKDVGSTIGRGDIPTESDILDATPDSRVYYFDEDSNDNGWYASPNGNGDPYGKTVSSGETTYTAAVYEHKFWAEFNPANGGSTTRQQYMFGSSVPMPQNEPTYSDHSFIGWKCDQGGTVYSTGQSYTHDYVANTVVFTAQWSNNQVSVSFYSEGALIETIPVNIGGTVTPPSVTVSDPETLRFKDAWIRRSDNYEYSTSELSALPINTGMTFDAKIVELHKVRFYTADNDRVGNTRTVEHNGHVTTPDANDVNAAIASSSSPDKTFMGDWRKNGPYLDNDALYPIMTKAQIDSMNIVEETNFYARLACTVTFNYGSVSSQSPTSFDVEKRSYLTSSQIPTPNAVSGYTFTGWDGDTSVKITDSITFTAQWTYVEPQPVVTHTVKFKNCNENILTSKTIEIEDGQTIPLQSIPSESDVTRNNNCLFTGDWTSDSLQVRTISSPITEDVIFTPVCSCSDMTYTALIKLTSEVTKNGQYVNVRVDYLDIILQDASGGELSSETINTGVTLGESNDYQYMITPTVGSFLGLEVRNLRITVGGLSYWLEGNQGETDGYFFEQRINDDIVPAMTFYESQVQNRTMEIRIQNIETTMLNNGNPSDEGNEEETE